MANVVFSPAQTYENLDWKKYYEVVDTSLERLETTIADVVYLDRASLDAPNIADSKDPTITNQLEYVQKTVDANGNNIYTWSKVQVVYAVDPNNPTVLLTDAFGNYIPQDVYYEVNFAHRLALWCQEVSEDDRTVLGVLGTSRPTANNKTAIANWLGKLPVYDANRNVTENGTGILGNRFMAGAIGYRKGFYYTDTGFPDGNILKDSYGNPIDIGKFIAVVPTSMINNASGTFANASLLAATIAQASAGTQFTNVTVPDVSEFFRLKKQDLNDLAGLGYTAFFLDSDGAVKISSGQVASSFDGDYRYLSTMVTISELTNDLRASQRPFLGRPLDQNLRAAMQEAYRKVLINYREAGFILNYDFQFTATAEESRLGFYRVPTLVSVPGELRRVSIQFRQGLPTGV